MAALCTLMDLCCCGLRPCCQNPNQCVQACGCGNRRTFYNFDKSVSVDPLVSYFKPTNSLARRNLVKGMSLDKKVLKKGLTAVEQIAEVVNFASENNLSARAVGTGSSWSEITTVRDILIDMTDLDRILEAKPQNSVSSVYHIEVQGGCVLMDFVREIDKRYGMAFPTLPGCTMQTVAGVVSTSTHGTGKDIQSLANFVVELHMIISKGVQIKIRQPTDNDEDEMFDSVKRKIEAAKCGDPPLEICSRDIFRAAAVGLGCMGIIYSVTFECIAVYNIKETRRQIDIKWSSKKQAGKFKIPSELKDLAAEPGKYLNILINPYLMESGHASGKSALSSAYLLGERTDEGINTCCSCECCYTECKCLNCCTPVCRCLLAETDGCSTCVQTMATCFPSCIPGFAELGLKQMVRGQSVPDVKRWYDVLGFVKGSVKWRQGSYFVPLCDVETALTDTIKLLQEYLGYRVYALPPIHVRMIKADDLYLSPFNRARSGGDTCDYYASIEVSFLLGAYGIDEFYNKLENHLYTQYKARPHWGKSISLNFDQVSQLYPDLDKWKQVYLLFNSDGTFDNEFTRKIGFEDFRTPEGYRWKISSSHVQVTVQHDDAGQPLLPTITAQTQQQEVTYTKVSHDDHDHVISSKVTSTEVISAQPKESNDRVFDYGKSHYGKSHFTPIPLSNKRC